MLATTVSPLALALALVSAFCVPRAATHALATVAFIFHEVGIGRVVRMNQSIAGGIALDQLFRITTNLRGRARTGHDPVKHFAILVTENHGITAVATGATTLLLRTSASTSATHHRCGPHCIGRDTVRILMRPNHLRCTRSLDKITGVRKCRASTTLLMSSTTITSLLLRHALLLHGQKSGTVPGRQITGTADLPFFKRRGPFYHNAYRVAFDRTQHCTNRQTPNECPTQTYTIGCC